MVVGGRDGFGDLGIPDHDVGIRAFHNRTLARVDVEDLRHIGRGRCHKLVGRQTPCLNPRGPEHRQALFQPV